MSSRDDMFVLTEDNVLHSTHADVHLDMLVLIVEHHGVIRVTLDILRLSLIHI